MTTPITSPGIYTNVSAKEYHDDLCATPSLSSSIAKVLITRSPKHAWTAHPKLGAARDDGEEVDEKSTKAQENGTLIHRMLIGAGGDIVECPFENWRKDAAKAMRDAAKAAGQIPTLPHLYSKAQAAAGSARKQMDELGFDYVFRDGLKEVVICWEEDGIMLRAMLDNLIIDEDTKTAELSDLKTVGRSSHPKACEKQIDDFGYDMSLLFHERGLLKLRPDLAGRVKKRLFFMEVDEPYSVTPGWITAEWEEAAQLRIERSIALWRKCLTENKWPHYTNEPVRFEPKPWQIMDAFLNQE